MANIGIGRQLRAGQAPPLQAQFDQTLLDAQAVLHFFEGVAFGFGVEEQNYEKLQHHHAGKDDKRSARRLRKEYGEDPRNNGVHDPM